jgi:hypothetical protein
MRRRYLAPLGALAVVLALISLIAVSIVGQAPSAAPSTTSRPALPKPGPAPKTAWGEPDLQGTWFVMEAVPLERSAANANKPLLTDAEVEAADKQKASAAGRNARSENPTQDVEGAYNAVFNSILRTSKRTSMIIDPPDGRIPPTVAAQAQGRGGGGAPAAGGAARGAAGAGGGGGGGARGAAGGGGGARGGRGSQNDNPETTAQNPRCLGVQMPFLPLNTAFAQGTVMQIVQSPKSMGIYMEDDHAGGGNRVIFMDGRPHQPKYVKSVLGDSRGRWEGNTLVVETTNFATGFRGSNPDTYRMIERFTRVDSNNLRREITFDDPQTWTRPWTVLIEMGKTDDRRHMIFDSACHEGNYGMTGILIGARKEEAAAK